MLSDLSTAGNSQFNLMDKERKAYEALLHVINIRSRSSSTPEQVHYQHQLQFLREFKSQTTGEPYGSNTTTQLAQLLTELLTLQRRGNADDSLNLNAWLLWLNELVLSHKLQLGDTQPLLKWLLQRVEQHPTATDALRCLLSVLESLPLDEAREHFPRLAVIPMADEVETALLLILCQDVSFGVPGELNENELHLSIQLANSLLKQHYEGHWTESEGKLHEAEQDRLQLLLAHTLQLIQKITTQNADYAQQHAPELLGFALANIRYGSEAQLGLSVPHRVQPAQQSAGYCQETVNSGNNQNVAASGRRAKSRKMRSLTKQRNNGNLPETSNASELAVGQGSDRVQQLLLHGGIDSAMRTTSGDSEGACTPTSDGAAQQLTTQKQHRQSQVKVRLAALQLLGAVTKQLSRRTLYGYWHALFPSNDDGNAKDHLLYIGANDGNVRCRALALQLAAQLIYGSKPYLAQANCASARSNYTPFTQSLASSVLTAYRQLTSILEREYATPVLTNCLKCLAVLVQATPFENLEMGFVYDFVPHVKNLAGHVDTSIKVSALLVMEMLMTSPRLTQEIACAVGLPISERRLAKTDTASMRFQVRQELREQQQFQQLCDSEDEEDVEEVEEETEADKENLNQGNTHLPWPRIPRNSWLLRLVLRYLECPVSAAPLRVECLQVLLAMSSHFGLLRAHLGRLAWVLCNALRDASRDVRLYGARCLDAVGYQMARHAIMITGQKNDINPDAETKALELPPESNAELQQRHLSFWQHMLPAIYAAYQDAGTTATLNSALCDALSNMGSYSFELLPQAQRNGLLAFLLGCSSDDSADRLVRAAALRALAVYVMHPTLRADLVFVEHAAELALRLSDDSQLVVRIKVSWALGNISDALLASSQTKPEQSVEHEQQPEQQERISQALLSRLIETTVQSCSDHDKVRSNAVRALGNLLRLLPSEEQALMQLGVAKLLDCVRAAGGAKVKWNACYAIGNLVRSRALFSFSASSAGTLFAALSQLIVQHSNFKVRINATAVLLQVDQRADFGTHFVNVWHSLLAAIERSHALDTFEEYNHRDALQQQLCLAMAHMLERARPDDLQTCRDPLEAHLEVVSDTWRRVAYRILPEQAAPLFTCASLLKQRFEGKPLASEQRNALTFLATALRLEG